MAQSLFKSNHTFDFDFWQQWQIKDLVDSIRKCKIRGDEKNRIAAHKALKLIIGEKVETPSNSLPVYFSSEKVEIKDKKDKKKFGIF